MKTRSLFTPLLAGVISVAAVADDNWPQFRGHRGLGVSSGNPPIEWDTQTGQNVSWMTPIPGLGHSAPIVWNAACS